MSYAGYDRQAAHQAHVIVCGNEKGGSGKTTTAMHLLIELVNAGYKVASIDLDTRQLSLTRYIENRLAWNRRMGMRMPVPDHYRLERCYGEVVSDNENVELGRFQEILEQTENSHDFIVIDTPGHDSFAMRLAHSMADTLITPINDSYVDFDVLARIDPATFEVTGISHYASMVREARRQRRTVDNGLLDWVVVRNRIAPDRQRQQDRIAASLGELSMRLGCRLADGISERAVFRELFPIGMTALDVLNNRSLGIATAPSFLSARLEIRALLAALKLPIDETGRRLAFARQQWIRSQNFRRKIAIDARHAGQFAQRTALAI
jgi:chromosome partitioning protein